MLIARNKEIAILKEAYESNESNYIAVIGRRRIGKTYLVKEVFSDSLFFNHAGLSKGGKKRQIEAFFVSLSEKGIPLLPLREGQEEDWLYAFSCLRSYILSLGDEGKKTVFLDELTWMARGARDEFLSALDSFWNSFAYFRKDILLIVSASATSWLLKNIVHSKGGVHHRLHHTLYLKPFTLAECEEYAASRGLSKRRWEIIETYMVFGGVPYYWSLLQKGESLPVALDRLVVDAEGELHNEFKYCFASIYDSPKQYMDIVAALGKKKKGLTREGIKEETAIPDGGTLTEKLEELTACGFIRDYTPYGKSKKGSLYQLVDFFTIFYFSFLENKSLDKHYFATRYASASFNAWKGLAFERVALLHVEEIMKALGVAGVARQSYSLIIPKDEAKGIDAHQIDLIVERADRVIDICEAKFYKAPYAISKEDAWNYDRLIEDFIAFSKTESSVHFVLVSPLGVAHNGNEGVVSNVVTLDDLFL